MSDTLPTQAAFLADPAFLPRVSQHDGKAIEQALAGRTLFDRGVQLRAAVVEASYAATDPPLLKRLREDGVPQIVDPQTVRFAGERFLQVEALADLPYAPDAPIQADQLPPARAAELVRSVMAFQQRFSAACYLAAALPYSDADLDQRIDQNDRLLTASAAANGTGDLDRRALVAQVFVGQRALAQPERIVERLVDQPIDAVYVQPTNLNPVKDSLEKLARYVHFLSDLREAGLHVIAGRVGAFGLVLQALDAALCFDSGLNQAEAFNLATLNRPVSDRERERRKAGRGGGPDRRVYFEPLKTTLMGRDAATVIATPALRGHLVCSLGCCQHRGFEDLQDRRRQHYLWVREHEVDELRRKSTRAMRIDLIHEQLVSARELGMRVRRALAKDGKPPSFEHLDRWIGLIAREGALPVAA